MGPHEFAAPLHPSLEESNPIAPAQPRKWINQAPARLIGWTGLGPERLCVRRAAGLFVPARASMSSTASVPGLPARLVHLLEHGARDAAAAEAEHSTHAPAAQQTPGTRASALKLAAIAARKQLGTCVMPDLLDDPVYADTIVRNFTHVVVEHHMKWEPLTSPTSAGSAWGGPYRKAGKQFTALSGCYDFGPADKIVDWAIGHGLNVKGHTLCWHVTSPAWLGELTSEQCAEALRRHIFTTCGHFRGRVESWDVVNEALAPDGSLADTVFLRKMGPGYIAQAFKWAREADADALLIYNDNKVEGSLPPLTKRDTQGAAESCCCAPVPDFYRKSDAMYALLQGLLDQGVPIGAVGLQAHFNAAGIGLGRCPSPAAVATNVKRLAALGLRVNISELDVRISKLPPIATSDTADKLRRNCSQAQIYHDVLNAALDVDGFEGVWLWGFTDKHTWVTEFYHEDAPLVFDTEFQVRKNLEFRI